MSDFSVICDLDGTLRHRREGDGERLWSDWHRVGEDVIDPVIEQLIDDVHSRDGVVLLVTGCPEEARVPTEMWLDSHLVRYEALLMRASGDFRGDAVVKTEIYEREILGRYPPVLYAIDDRQSTVAAWRALGIKTLQVDVGDF